MVNQQLLDYIKQQSQQGMNSEQIKQSLFATGCQNADIEEAFKSLDNINLENHIEKTRYGKFSLICLIITIIFYFFAPKFKSIFYSGYIASAIIFVMTVVALLGFYFFLLWIVELVNRRGKVERSPNKKAKIIINIIFVGIFLLISISAIVNWTSGELTPQQLGVVMELSGKNNDFNTANEKVKTVAQSLEHVMASKDWGRTKTVLQELMLANQEFQSKIPEMRSVAEKYQQLFNNKNDREWAAFYLNILEEREKYCRKINEFTNIGLQIDWSNPDKERINQMLEVYNELSKIYNDIKILENEYKIKFGEYQRF